MTLATTRAVFGVVVFLAPLACTLPDSRPQQSKSDTLPSGDSSISTVDDSSADDSSAYVDDSSVPDDSSVTSGDIEWILVDSTDGPISHQWAGCDPHQCNYSTSESCGGVSLGVVATQEHLNTVYAEFLPGVDYVPKIDFSSHSVMWVCLCCCPSHGQWVVVDDVTRVGHTLEMSLHVESLKLAPAAFGRPWVVVQVPIGDYDDVAYTLKE
jgi:hypothetical protein